MWSSPPVSWSPPESTPVVATLWQRASLGGAACSVTSRSQSNRSPLVIGFESKVSSTMRYSRRPSQAPYPPPLGLAAGCVPHKESKSRQLGLDSKGAIRRLALQCGERAAGPAAGQWIEASGARSRARRGSPRIAGDGASNAAVRFETSSGHGALDLAVLASRVDAGTG